MIRILFLAATIAEDYNFKSKELDYYHSVKSINESMVKEYKRINTALMKSRYRDKFDLRFIPSVTVGDAKESLSYYEPNIVHFSGMALPADEGVPSEEDELVEKSHILMEDEGQNVIKLSADYVSNLFKIANNRKNIKCVALSAPYSLEHAESIKKYVPSVIAFNTLSNAEAESFFARFYELLGAGLSVALAFDSACDEVFRNPEKRILLGERHESYLPMLKYAPGVDPSKIVPAKRKKT
jgi:hypothetical protein